eukprot:272936-Prymnesium_polylepis.1
MTTERISVRSNDSQLCPSKIKIKELRSSSGLRSITGALRASHGQQQRWWQAASHGRRERRAEAGA